MERGDTYTIHLVSRNHLKWSAIEISVQKISPAVLLPCHNASRFKDWPSETFLPISPRNSIPQEARFLGNYVGLSEYLTPPSTYAVIDVLRSRGRYTTSRSHVRADHLQRWQNQGVLKLVQLGPMRRGFHVSREFFQHLKHHR